MTSNAAPSDVPLPATSGIDLEAGSPAPSSGSGVTEEKSAEVAAPGKEAKAAETHVIPKNNLALVFSGLMLTTFLAALDQTIVSTALPTITRELGGTESQYAWVYGKFAQIFGRKPVLYFAITMFLFGSAMCGAAKSMTWLCALRGIQGIGGGGILQVTQIVISDIVPLHRRGAYSGGIGATWGIAAVLGPLCGGLLTEYVSWRWCFFINLPTGGFALALLVFSLKLNPHKGMTFADFKRTFDFFGLFLIIAGVVCVLIGFSSGQTAWKTPETIVLLTVGGLTLVAAVFWETYTTRSPIIPPRLFKFISSSYYLPLYFQILGASATLSGVAMLPLSVGSAIVSIGSGFLLAKTQQYRGIIIASFFFCVLSFSLIATLDESSSRAKQEIYLLLAAFGTGALFQTPLVALQAAVPISDMATATASLGLVRQLAGTTSISIGGAIYSSELKRRLRTVSGYTASRSALAGNVIELNKIEPLALREEVLHAFTRSINTVYYLVAPLVLVGFVASLFLKHYTLQRNVVRTDAVSKEKPTEESSSADLAPLDSAEAIKEDEKKISA